MEFQCFIRIITILKIIVHVYGQLAVSAAEVEEKEIHLSLLIQYRELYCYHSTTSSVLVCEEITQVSFISPQICIMKAPKLSRVQNKSLKRTKHAANAATESKKVNNKLTGQGAIQMPKIGASRIHQQELSDLQTTDPEFFQFLQENDENLLNFETEDGDDEPDDDDEEEDMEGDESDEIEEDEQPVVVKGKKLLELRESQTIDVDEKILDNTLTLASAGSITALQRLLSIFRAACIPTNSTIQNDDDEVNEQPTNRFVVNNPQIYEKVMSKVFEVAILSFQKALELAPGASGDDLTGLDKHPKWKKMKPLVQLFYKSVLFTLSSLLDSHGGGEVTSFVLSSIDVYIPLLTPLPRLAKALIKVLLAIWSQNTPVTEGANTRIYAYLRIRQMSLVLPGAFAEDCFRSIYLSYARASKTFSTVTSSSVLFMSKCLVELYLTDTAIAYQQVFVYIRQLALLLRSALQKKTAEASKQILNWQYLNCIRVWTRVICAMPTKDELGDLAFPLVQIALGVISAAPAAVNIPLRFHLLSCLHQLAAHCQLFIPTASKLIEVLDIADLFAKPIASTEAPPTLAHIIRFLPEACGKPVVRDLIVSEVVALLQHDAEIYRYHVGFPEYTFLTIRKLRAFIKKSKIGRWRDVCRSLVNQLEQQGTLVKKLRVKLGKAPMEITDFESLLPATTAIASVRVMKLLNSRAITDVSEVTVSAVIKEKKDEDAALVVKKKTKSAAKNSSKDKHMTEVSKTAEAVGSDPRDMLEDDEVEELTWSDEDDDE
jgi:nucleolar complex protein 2